MSPLVAPTRYAVGVPYLRHFGRSVGTQKFIMSYVYILKSLDKNKYYVGSTDNLKDRLRHHFGGHTPSTKKLGNLKLALSQEYSTLEEARKVERKLKNLKRKDYIEKIIEDGYIKLK